MIRPLLLATIAVSLAACAESPKVAVTHTKPAPAVVTKSRSEPIFYNGKTYNLAYDYVPGSSAFAMRVAGMGAGQQKDAVAVATSSLGYFACPDGQRGKLTSTPQYKSGLWVMDARCG